MAIGRAIAFRPRLLLLDEPLAALDEDHRLRLLALLKSLRCAEQVTTLHVTHYSDEAAAVGEHFFRLVNGEIVSTARPVADQPRRTIAAEGETNRNDEAANANTSEEA